MSPKGANVSDMDEELITAAQARAILKVSRQTLWRLEKSGAVTAHKVGTVKRFRKGDITGARKPK